MTFSVNTAVDSNNYLMLGHPNARLSKKWARESGISLRQYALVLQDNFSLFTLAYLGRNKGDVPHAFGQFLDGNRSEGDVGVLRTDSWEVVINDSLPAIRDRNHIRREFVNANVPALNGVVQGRTAIADRTQKGVRIQTSSTFADSGIT